MHSPASLHLAFLPLKWHDPQVCLIQCLSDPIISQTCHKILTWPRHLLVIFLYLVWLSFCSSLLWKLRDNSREEFAVLSLKPWSDVVKIPIYLTWTISNDLMFQPINMDHTLNPWKEPFLVSPLYSQTEPAVFYFWRENWKFWKRFQSH